MKYIIRLVGIRAASDILIRQLPLPANVSEWMLDKAENVIMYQILYVEEETVDSNSSLYFIERGEIFDRNCVNYTILSSNSNNEPPYYRFCYASDYFSSLNKILDIADVKKYLSAIFSSLTLQKRPNNICGDKYLEAEALLKTLVTGPYIYSDEKFPLTLSEKRYSCLITGFSILEKTAAGNFCAVDWKTYYPEDPQYFHLQFLFTLACKNGESTIIRCDIISEMAYLQKINSSTSTEDKIYIVYPLYVRKHYNLKDIMRLFKDDSWRTVGGNLSEILIKMAYGFVSIDPQYSIDKLLGKPLLTGNRIPLRFGGIFTDAELPQPLKAWDSPDNDQRIEIPKHYFSVNYDYSPNIFMKYFLKNRKSHKL